eukprot:gene4868-8462_t
MNKQKGYAKLTSALNNDDKRNYQLAFTEYLEFVENASKHLHLKALNAPEAEVLKLFKCANESLNRAEHLYKNHRNSFNSNTTNSPICGHNDDKKLQEMISKKPSSSSQQQVKTDSNNSGETGGFPRKYQIPKPKSPSVISTTNPITPNVPPRTTSKSIPNPNMTKSFPPPVNSSNPTNPSKNRQYQMSIDTNKPNYKTNDIYALENQKLSHMISSSDTKSTFQLQKRYLENLAIQKQVESSYKKFLEEQEKIRKNEEHEERRKKAKTFRWRTEDKWSLFIEKKFFYDEFTNLDEDLTWIEALQNSQHPEEVINGHLSMLTSSKHPLGHLISNFNSYLIQIHKLDNPHTNIAHKDILVDVNGFIEKIIEILFVKYWKFDSELLADSLASSIEKTIFLNGLYHKIISHYQKKYSSHDLRFIQKCEKLKDISLIELEVSSKFLLKNQLHPYSKVIDLLKKMNYPSSCDDKIDIISKSISEISLSVVDYYKGSKLYKKEDLILGAEDMLPIFIYSLIQSKISSMYSILMFLIDFMDDDTIKGSEGYCMATLETAINEILNFEIKELQKNPKTINLNFDSSKPPNRTPPTPSSQNSDDFFGVGLSNQSFDGYF